MALRDQIDQTTLEIIDRFRSALEQRMSRNTARAYVGDVRTFAQFLVAQGKRLLLDVREEDVSLEREGARDANID